MSPVNHYKKAENRFVSIVGEFFRSLGTKLSSFFYEAVNMGKQRFTVMFIPHCEKKIFNFRISIFSLIVTLFLVSCMLLSFILFTTRFTGVSKMLASKSQTLEKKESDLDFIRDQISELKNVSRVFEASLAKTLDTLGLEKNSAENDLNIAKGDVNLAGFDVSSEDVILRELDDLKYLSSFLKESMEYFDEISKLLTAQQELIVELPTMWPLKNVRGRITAYFGPSIHPFTRTWYLHKGIDLAYSRGTPIIATANGKIIEKGFEPYGYGNYIVIKHKYGFYTKYAHLDRVYVKEGQTILQGDTIGTMGNTGLSTGPHLHYEVRIGSQVVDPQRYLNIKNRSGL